MNRIPLTQLNGELRKLTEDPTPGYRKLYLAALDGTLPVERLNGRVFVRADDLPAIAAALGLTLAAHAAA